MNNKIKYILIVASILLLVWTIARLTNMLQWFSAPTTSNYPTIKSGDMFFASNLMKPKKFDFICYYSTTPEFGKQIWVHRLCGLEGDTIEIKQGVLLINNKSFDNNLSLSHNYFVSVKEIEKVGSIEKIDETFIQNFSADSAIVNITDKTALKFSTKLKRQILTKDHYDDYITKQYSRLWNQDNFGPIVIPKNKYFVLGDNRQNSQDSRYIGFIDKSNYVATVIGR